MRHHCSSGGIDLKRMTSIMVKILEQFEGYYQSLITNHQLKFSTLGGHQLKLSTLGGFFVSFNLTRSSWLTLNHFSSLLAS